MTSRAVLVHLDSVRAIKGRFPATAETTRSELANKRVLEDYSQNNFQSSYGYDNLLNIRLTCLSNRDRQIKVL